MHKDDFKKGIENIKQIKMTDTEKSTMLARIFSMPIKSPYTKYSRTFVYIKAHSVRAIIALCIMVGLSFGGVAYASGDSFPGTLLYPVKTKIVEPILDVVN